MFTTRLKSDIPYSVQALVQGVQDKSIVELNLAHNAFGPPGA
jgi:Ran GTPase-activating protein (RanGAP) involved in mRNA processing and transport